MPEFCDDNPNNSRTTDAGINQVGPEIASGAMLPSPETADAQLPSFFDPGNLHSPTARRPSYALEWHKQYDDDPSLLHTAEVDPRCGQTRHTIEIRRAWWRFQIRRVEKYELAETDRQVSFDFIDLLLILF